MSHTHGAFTSSCARCERGTAGQGVSACAIMGVYHASLVSTAELHGSDYLSGRSWGADGPRRSRGRSRFRRPVGDRLATIAGPGGASTLPLPTWPSPFLDIQLLSTAN
eukprot:366025-Chlamydomonas_euryale.AAC.3